jgi:hypothetical protein
MSTHAGNWLDRPSELAYISPVYSYIGSVPFCGLVVHHTSSTYKEAAHA